MSVFSLSGLHVLYVEQCTVKRRQSGSASSSPLSHREPLTGRGGRATHTPSRPASPRGKRPSSQPFPGALPALSVFLLTCEPPGCSPKDSAAGAAAAAAAAAGRVDLRKTEGTPRVGSRRQPARSPGHYHMTKALPQFISSLCTFHLPSWGKDKGSEICISSSVLQKILKQVQDPLTHFEKLV
uniref:Uncharacterized protein n=1 Tax=Molossus molossus TaxID=27622 RepID=A0A7J8HZY9_MOLMO|nr:hypothetical protein HJG59_010848 [Molossus molossus]